MGLMDIGNNNPYAIINPFAAVIDSARKGWNENEARISERNKEALAQQQQAMLMKMKQDEADRLTKQAEAEAVAKGQLQDRMLGKQVSIPASQMRPQGLLGDIIAQSPVPREPFMYRDEKTASPMNQQELLNFSLANSGTQAGKDALEQAKIMIKDNPNEFYQKLIASGKYTPESVAEFAAGKGKLQFAKDPSVVTWSEPFKTEIGGKKALVQQSSTGQIRPVIEDKSTTVVVNGEQNKPGRVLPAAQLETIADMRKVKEVLESAQSSIGKVATGPVSGRTQSLMSMVGMSSDQFNDVRQKLATAENIMLKLRSGAAVTEPEWERFKNEYPSVNDTPAVRDRKMANAIKYANDLMDTKLQVFKDGGYRVPESAYSRGGKVPKLKGQTPIGKVGKYSYTVSK